MRRMRHEKFAPFVRAVLKENNRQNSRNTHSLTKEKLRQFKKEELKKKHDYE